MVSQSLNFSSAHPASSIFRQIIHDTNAVNTKKCVSAVTKMKALNDQLRYTAIDSRISSANAVEHFWNYDLIVDATDNFEARYVNNEITSLICHEHLYIGR